MQTKNQRNRNRQKQSENDEISNKKGAYENHINPLKLFLYQYVKIKTKSRLQIVHNPSSSNIITDVEP